MLQNKVLCRIDPEKEQNDLIHIPESNRSTPITATVVAIGPHVSTVNKGDRVGLPWATGTELDIYEIAHRIVTEDQLICCISS